jgi:hypothetical protein
LYRARGSIDAAFGATSFASALDWVVGARAPIREIQFWGYGKWGRALIDRESLDRSSLGGSHALRPRLEAVRESLTPDALIWFRTCETLGARPGQDFARALADFMGARVAGHTFVIGYWQSGLHRLAPGELPSWDPQEGLALGTAERPERALPSAPSLPQTISCWTSNIPAAWR